MTKSFSLHFLLFVLAVGGINASQSAQSARPAEVWISAQAAATEGVGTQSDPYDGSTQPKFDALMQSFQRTPHLTIHLGPGVFRSDVTAPNHWLVQSGWIIDGAGMYQTTCQMMGNLAGQHFDHEFFKSAYNVATDNVNIRDLTVDCNWAELEPTADVGAKGEKFGAIFAIALGGNHILVERVRHLNSRGSWANLNEAFGIGIGAPSTGDISDNIIRNCRAESPQGNYGSPFALHGWPYPAGNGPHYITDSSAYGNYAAGQQNGLTTGFTTGGVNGAFSKNCQIHDNTFIDCQSVYYQDTGDVENLRVVNNTLTRGWMGVVLAAGEPAWTKTGVTISGNQINLQNRVSDYGSASYGVSIYGSLASEVTISGNNFTFTPTGQGFLQFATIVSQAMDDSVITANTANEASAGTGVAAPVHGLVLGYNTTINANKTATGRSMTGLADTYLQPLARALNLSTRALVGTGQNQLINGFVIAGPAPKKVLVRAIGPSLDARGVANSLPDPKVSIYDNTGELLAQNDNWRSTQRAAIAATGIAPSSDLESAMIVTLPPGAYTAVMSDANSQSGIGLLEVYDLAPDDQTVLLNVSTRGYAGTNDDVIIGGLIVSAGENATFVMRAIGPSLGSAQIRNPLSDPVLELHDGNGQLIDMNDNWKDSQQDEITASGLAPTNNAEAALIESLPSGNYTTVVRGKGSATGVALVEIYRIR